MIKDIKSFENEIDQENRKNDISYWLVDRIVNKSTEWIPMFVINLSGRLIEYGKWVDRLTFGRNRVSYRSGSNVLLDEQFSNLAN